MKLLICGDYTTCNRGLEAVKRKEALSQSVISVIRGYDAAIVNLEAPVVRQDAKRIAKYGPHLSTTSEAVSYLMECGFGNVTLANNHFYDYGDSGVEATVKALVDSGIRYVGGGRNEKEKSSPLINSILSEDLCIYNYCESEFSVGHKMGSNRLDPIHAYYEIKKAKEGGQFVVIIIHGGHEGYQLPSPRMKQLYRFFIDSGANVIVNHHQHCYSGYEHYNGGLIFYGLGNLFFDKLSMGANEKWFEGYMVGLTIEGGRLASFELYPYYQCKNNCIQTCLMDEEGRKVFYQNIQNLNAIIADDEQLVTHFEKFVDSQRRNYFLRFSPYTFGKLIGACRKGLLPLAFTKKQKIRILNAISCEAHRDVCIYLLNKEI